MKKLFIVLTLVIFAVPLTHVLASGYGVASYVGAIPNIEITLLGVSKFTLPTETGYSISGYFKIDKETPIGQLKIKAFLDEQALKNSIPLVPSTATEFCGISGDSFGCYFSPIINSSLTSDSEIILKFYDNDKYIGESTSINFKHTVGGTLQPMKDRLKKLTDIDGDGLSGDADKFPTIPNVDGKSPIVIGNSVAYDECSASIKNKIKFTPQKTTDQATSTDSYQILIDLPEFGSIKDDADGNTVTSTEEYTFACEEKNAENSAEENSPLWNGTVKDVKLSYTCTIDGDLKGNEKIPVSFLYEYTDKDGSDPSKCLVTLGKGKEVNLASSVVLTNETPTGSSDASGGDCSLNVAASTHGFGWLVDMLVLGLPAVLVGRRRNKIQ